MRLFVILVLLLSLGGCNWAHAPGAVVQPGIWAGAGIVAGVDALVDEVEGEEEVAEMSEADEPQK